MSRSCEILWFKSTDTDRVYTWCYNTVNIGCNRSVPDHRERDKKKKK